MKPMFDHFLFGGDWNPEQWPEDTWEHDLDMLEDAHINEVTINVFSWALLQPAEDRYDFSMLDKIVALLVKHDFNIVMATGTAALPGWMVRLHPETIRTEQNGTRHVFGGRHNFCPTSPYFRKASRALAAHVAERYAGTSGLVAWHVCNEYGGGGGLCYCDHCAEAFRTWLKNKYGTVEALNKAWCANFWSHTIYDWGDVVPPVSYGDGISDAKCVVSGLQMDYRRFQNQAQLACYTNERDAIRAYDAATPITTNLMGTFKDLDYFEWAKEMDMVSWDNYPGMDTPPSFTAMCHDLMRGIGGNKPFMLMEQTPNRQNWFPFCKVKRPGEVRKLSWQAVAHGADTVQFFQIKQSIGGCERFHGAVIAHDGTEQSRVFKETTALGGELDRIGKRIMGSEIRAKVAIMFDWQSYWSLEGCVGPTAGFSYPNEVHRFYRAFWRRNVPVDIIESTTPLDKLKQYDLVVAPALIT
ncbi:beta-galactosidase, partial [uncultured Bifidobacterium sp.]|uniref:beta-galactosidase n=1 Tax=uncultured Bifidobacterium sp. TaxID=165187 RepID=UPI002598FB60